MRMRGSARTDHHQVAPQQQGPPQNQLNQIQQPSASAPVPNAQQVPLQPLAYRQQPTRACFNCGDPSHFVVDCPLKARAQKPVQ